MTISQEKNEAILPPVELLEKYEKISKGLSKELVSLLKKEQEHRHKMQKMYLRNFRLGQLFGAAFLLFMILVIFELAKNGSTDVSCIMSAVLGILMILIAYKHKKDRANNFKRNFNKNHFFKKNRNFNKNNKLKSDKQINKNEVN